MDDASKSKILELLDQHRLVTVATNRPDGWPQATTVGYVNDGLTIYFLCSPQSQKAANLARDNRISLTIDHDVSDPMAITGLSMAAQAHPVTDPDPSSEGHETAGDEIPRVCGIPDAEAGGKRGLPGGSEGDFRPRLLEGFWTLRSRRRLSSAVPRNL
jgi:Pyridoxamine 5'-phosphate oxidase